MRASVLVLTLLAAQAAADVYLHVPRGSNNRLREQTANRRNANRIFDSQNNNKGGYNVGDATDDPHNDQDGQYWMKYFQSDDEGGRSVLRVEWTNQHGCGGNEDDNPQKQNCQLVLQYACQDNADDAEGEDDSFRNGESSNTPSYSRPRKSSESRRDRDKRKARDVRKSRGLHEAWDNYDKCYNRYRNKGLFTADQNLEGDKAIYTRQNPDGTRRGLECPEERDYFPYWHPTVWRDITVKAENRSMCSYYRDESFNAKGRHECMEDKGWSRANNAKDCETRGGEWVEKFQYLEKLELSESECRAARHLWAVPADALENEEECLVRVPKPSCAEAPWSRSNHLGNGATPTANTFDWVLPYFPSGKEKRCVFRMRYNISTDDYDPYNTDASSNDNDDVIENDPEVDIGAGAKLDLAINTAQTGRVFQDRSHVFLLRPRPANLVGKKIWNLNVRGKRGNIVQTFPAVEYDFAPNNLVMREGELVHVQWTGSNTHDNAAPAGDGQAGDDGEGEGGTDRSNILQIQSLNDNYPAPMEGTDLWDNAEVKWIYHGATGVNAWDLAVNMASSGYYRCHKEDACKKFGDDISDYAMDNRRRGVRDQLDNAPASYEGAVLEIKKGKYYYMCSRNNNFTNRSQKGTITVVGAKGK